MSNCHWGTINRIQRFQLGDPQQRPAKMFSHCPPTLEKIKRLMMIMIPIMINIFSVVGFLFLMRITTITPEAALILFLIFLFVIYYFIYTFSDTVFVNWNFTYQDIPFVLQALEYKRDIGWERGLTLMTAPSLGNIFATFLKDRTRVSHLEEVQCRQCKVPTMKCKAWILACGTPYSNHLGKDIYRQQ